MKKRVFILSIFPEYFNSFQEMGIISKALNGERAKDIEISLEIINIRDFAKNNYKSVDDYPYGGGAGMVMKADVLADAINLGILEEYKIKRENIHIIYPGPRGKTFHNKKAQALAREYFSTNRSTELVFICGRYEGVDERFIENYVDEHISLGDFILTGGELAVMSILDASFRFVEGFLGNRKSHIEESFQNKNIEYPQYTRPLEFEGKTVPEVLSNGHHKKIEDFKLEKGIEFTKKFRPDLLEEKSVE